MFNLKRGRRTFTAGRPPTNNLKKIYKSFYLQETKNRFKLRRQDSNLQPQGNEPCELPLLHTAMLNRWQKSRLLLSRKNRVSKFDTLFLFLPKNEDFCNGKTPMPALL